jgi:methylmalonyl-CoA mutase C-terminal domain/subunit
LKEKGINDVLVVGGGVIPDEDKLKLEKAGINGVFGPGTPLPTVIDHITKEVVKVRKI